MNRDEYVKRPTAKLDWKEDILAGRDLEPGKEGGTWLAINRKGHIGLLTNIYAGKSSPGAGTGFLVINALKENDIQHLWLPDIVYDNTDQTESTKLGDWKTSIAITREGNLTRAGVEEVDEGNGAHENRGGDLPEVREKVQRREARPAGPDRGVQGGA